MVLESLLGPKTAEKHPWELIFIGILYCSLAIVLSLWIFEKNASIVFVLLTVMVSVPLMFRLVKYEEKKDLIYTKEESLLKEHSKAIAVFMYLFLGITIAVAVFYVIIPGEHIPVLFSSQTDTISRINGGIVGYATHTDLLAKIFLNNVRVMIFCILFAFLYGVGAVFILTWNASVIGVAMGNIIRTKLAEFTALVGIKAAGAYLYVVSYSLLRYSIHGIFEIAAYFVAGLAGSIISVAVIRHDLRSKKAERIIMDTSELVLISILLLAIGSLIEVYITPLIF